MKNTLPSYQLEARDLTGQPELISRGETLESGLAAFEHFVRLDAAYGNRFSPRTGHRLVLTQGATAWVPRPLHPENLVDTEVARLLQPARHTPRPLAVDGLLDEVDRLLDEHWRDAARILSPASQANDDELRGCHLAVCGPYDGYAVGRAATR